MSSVFPPAGGAAFIPVDKSRGLSPRRGKQAYRPDRRSRNELLTTVTEESAMAAAAKMGAFSRKNGMSGESIAVGIRMTL